MTPLPTAAMGKAPGPVRLFAVVGIVAETPCFGTEVTDICGNFPTAVIVAMGAIFFRPVRTTPEFAPVVSELVEVVGAVEAD